MRVCVWELSRIYFCKLDLGGKKWEVSDGTEEEEEEAKQVEKMRVIKNL